MNANADAMTSSLHDRQSVFDCNIEELKQLVNEYPYFAPAKFLMAKKMKEKNSFLHEEHVQNASIYFQNPLWLAHLLDDKVNAPTTLNPDLVPGSGESDRQTQITQTEKEMPAVPEWPEAAPEEQTEQEGSAVVIPADLPGQSEEALIEDAPVAGEPALKIPGLRFEPVDPNKNVLSFEPYHTVDYFASQGIKAKEEEKSKDSFSRQLKSFTEWIREMKRLPASEIAAGVSATDEKKVEKMAEVSIHDREVVTEAMAEVWEKQGNTRKALETYNKLSLLNPGKSAYFAAKIDHLKNL